MKLSRLCLGIFFVGLSLQDIATASVTRTVPNNYSCYNTNVVGIDDWSAVDISSFAQAAQFAGGQSLRLPGGDTGNYWDWDRGEVVNWFSNGEVRPLNKFPYFLPQAIPNSLNFKNGINATLENVAPFITEANADPIWVMNMNTSYLEKELRHLEEAAALGMSVNRIELGNELYFSLPNYTRPESKSANPKRVGGFPTPEDYAATAKEWTLAIKDVFPDADIALTGVVPEESAGPRINGWLSALQEKTGEDNRSAIEVADAITLHPYYSTSDLGVTQTDIGDRARAGQIARDGLSELRSIVNDTALQTPELQNKQIWITEHNVLENGNDIALGNSWVHALMVDVQTHEFLKDERTAVSCAHVLTGSAQWQGITNEDGVGIDGELRGIEDRPVGRDGAFSQTAIGFVLGQTADVFTEGEASLLYSGDASNVWRVQNEESDTISGVNAGDIDEFVELPEGEIWEVLTYVGDPWSTPEEFDLDISLELLTGGSLLTIPAFSKVVASANGSDLALQAADSSNSLFAAARGADIAELSQNQQIANSEQIPEPATGAGLGLSAAALILSRRKAKGMKPRFSR